MDISIEQFSEIANTVGINLHENHNLNNVNAYLVINVPQTVRYRIFIWWEHDSKGYTQEINKAKIFTKNEIEELLINREYQEWENKKYLAVPIDKVITKLGSNIVPYQDKYINIIVKNKDITIGNKNLFLTEEEIKEYY